MQRQVNFVRAAGAELRHAAPGEMPTDEYNGENLGDNVQCGFSLDADGITSGADAPSVFDLRAETTVKSAAAKDWNGADDVDESEEEGMCGYVGLGHVRGFVWCVQIQIHLLFLRLLAKEQNRARFANNTNGVC